MKTWLMACTLTLSCAVGAAGAADAPSTPPPATGVVNPLTGDRDSAPSASPATTTQMGCRGTALDITTAPPVRTTGVQGVEPKMYNGGPTPATPASSDPTWCAGAYSPTTGTNFAGAP